MVQAAIITLYFHLHQARAVSGLLTVTTSFCPTKSSGGNTIATHYCASGLATNPLESNRQVHSFDTSKRDHIHRVPIYTHTHTHTHTHTPTHIPPHSHTTKSPDISTKVMESAASGQRADPDLVKQMREKRQRKIDKRTNLLSPSPPPPPTPQQRYDDWEATALAGIRSKNLHLNHDWNERTWSNKAKIEERLKLLKDAGIDISPLSLDRLKKDRSTTISKELCKLIERRKQQAQNPDPLPFDVSSGLLNGVESEELPFDPLFDEPTSPSPLANKRKREETPVEQSPEASANANEGVDQDPPSFKKLCMASLRAVSMNETHLVEEIHQKWNDHKDMVLTQIFDPCRVAIDFEPERANAPASHIIIKFPSLDDVVAASPLELGKLGYKSIMDELEVLSDSTEDQGALHILEPMIATAIDATAFRLSIKVITNVRHQTILEGNIMALMGLLSRLSKKRVSLAHREKLCFDKDGTCIDRHQNWELSDKTQKQLEDIKDALETGCEDGSMDVTVAWKGEVLFKKKDKFD